MRDGQRAKIGVVFLRDRCLCPSSGEQAGGVLDRTCSVKKTIIMLLSPSQENGEITMRYREKFLLKKLFDTGSKELELQ